MNMKMILPFIVLTLLCFSDAAHAINVGELDDNLRISADGADCVRPILILSVKDKINVYITGEIIKERYHFA